MLYVFICRVYNETKRMRYKIWTYYKMRASYRCALTNNTHASNITFPYIPSSNISPTFLIIVNNTL